MERTQIHRLRPVRGRRASTPPVHRRVASKFDELVDDAACRDRAGSTVASSGDVVELDLAFDDLSARDDHEAAAKDWERAPHDGVRSARRLPEAAAKTSTATQHSHLLPRQEQAQCACAARLVRLSHGGVRGAKGRANAIKAKAAQRAHTAGWSLRYFAECADYKRLDERTQRTRRGILEHRSMRPIALRLDQAVPRLSAASDDEVMRIEVRAIAARRAGGAEQSGEAIRQVFKWAVRKKGPDGKGAGANNQAREVPYFSTGPTGWHLEVEEVSTVYLRIKDRQQGGVAIALFLNTGQRRFRRDPLRPPACRNGKLRLSTFTRPHRNQSASPCQCCRTLQAIIDASLMRGHDFSKPSRVRPSPDGDSGNWFRDRCIEAGCPAALTD